MAKTQIHQVSYNLEQIKRQFALVNVSIYECKLGGYVVIDDKNTLLQAQKEEDQYVMPFRFKIHVGRVLNSELLEDVKSNFVKIY